jgi:hypothetical protein
VTASLPTPGQPSPPDDVEILTRYVLGRRTLLRVGGIAAASAAFLAACGGRDSPAASGQVPEAGTGENPPTTVPVVLSNVSLLRTAESVVRAAIATYQGVLDAGKVTTPDVLEAVRLFQRQYGDHIDALTLEIERADGQPYDLPNPLLMSRLVTPGLKALTDEVSAIALAQKVESVTSDTYQLFLPQLTTGALRLQVMRMGGVAGRHDAVMAMSLPYGVVVQIPDNTVLPEGVTTTTTTTVAGTIVPDPVYAVPGAFGSTANGVGPSYLV